MNTELSDIWMALETLTDPEIPVVSLREMGILRDVRGDAAQGYEVVITPTYSGDRKSTRLNSSHMSESRMPSSA